MIVISYPNKQINRYHTSVDLLVWIRYNLNFPAHYYMHKNSEECVAFHTTPAVAYRITICDTHWVAAITGCQSTVINMQVQITHRWQLSWPTHTACVYVMLCSAVRTDITCGGLLLSDQW